jgi:hypothetical protein
MACCQLADARLSRGRARQPMYGPRRHRSFVMAGGLHEDSTVETRNMHPEMISYDASCCAVSFSHDLEA